MPCNPTLMFYKQTIYVVYKKKETAEPLVIIKYNKNKGGGTSRQSASQSVTLP